jgi:succinate-semialdehyde dehydrogenase/glutarate-semialdehyde dehydrogenase
MSRRENEGMGISMNSIMLSFPRSFTGSVRVGKLLTEQCAPTLKKLTMELGGNAPFIVFPDANIHEAVEAGIKAKFRNNGQSCICANRFYIHKDIYQDFVRAFARQTSLLKVGNGMDR